MDVYSRVGIGVQLNWQSERTGRENKLLTSDWPRGCNPQSEIYNLDPWPGS